jgi:hypothetical protein
MTKRITIKELEALLAKMKEEKAVAVEIYACAEYDECGDYASVEISTVDAEGYTVDMIAEWNAY